MLYNMTLNVIKRISVLSSLLKVILCSSTFLKMHWY